MVCSILAGNSSATISRRCLTRDKSWKIAGCFEFLWLYYLLILLANSFSSLCNKHPE
jgi:hypothetical protein